MKYILTCLLTTIAFCGFSQQKETDENGRPRGAKPAFAVSSVDDVFLTKGTSAASSEVKINYSLPKGMSSGKIALFNPRRDEEIKSYTLNTESGSISINLKELPLSEFSVGLYDSSGKHLKAINIYN